MSLRSVLRFLFVTKPEPIPTDIRDDKLPNAGPAGLGALSETGLAGLVQDEVRGVDAEMRTMDPLEKRDRPGDE